MIEKWVSIVIREGELMKAGDLKYFFTYETEIPDGIGFGIFHPGHLIWLTLIVVVTLLLLSFYRKSNNRRKKGLEFGVAFSMVGWMAIRALYIAVIGEDFLYELPFHLCSMAGILCGFHCVFRWQWLGQVLYTLCLPGAVMALLFPDWSFYPAIHFISIEAFLFHMGIVVYVGFQLCSGGIVPRIRLVWQVILFLVIVVIPIYIFDRAYHVNYMFVNWPSAGSPLEWMADFMGNPGYLIGYGGLVMSFILLMNLGYSMIARLCNKK